MAGRMLDFAFDPNNANVIWAGAADGGLWKSTTGGSSWTPADDQLPTLAIGCVVTHPTSSSIIYIGTGEGSFNIDAAEGVGVLKSTDGGATWSQTGLSWLLSQGQAVNQMVIDPANPNVLVAATRDGVYRTQDAGTSWTRTLGPSSGRMDAKDIVLNPANSNILFVAVGYPWGDNNNGIYKSTDNGLSWTKLSSGLPAGSGLGRISIGISTSNPSTVYAGAANTIGAGSTLLGIYRTTDAGANWTLQSSSPNHYNGQGWYNNSIAVDPANPNIVYSGGTSFYKTTDGGSSWATITNGMHVDFHAIAFNSGVLYAGCDGGAYKSSNGGTSWTSLNNGLVTMQFYKMGSDPNNGNKAMGGTQDNGSNEYSGSSTWATQLGGDGGEVVYDYSNSNIVYGEYQNGSHNKSTNGGSSWFAINTGVPAGPWVTPFEMDPLNHNVLFTIGSGDLYRSTNGGAGWSLLFNATDNFSNDIQVAPTNNQVIYVCGTNSIYQSTDGGASFGKISGGLPVASITAMAVDPVQPLTLYVSNGSWSATSHVFKTTNSGASWQNLTTGLPNVPCNTMVIDPDNPNILYVGTDLGIHASTDGGATWNAWDDGLPNVVVDELDIQKGARVIRAATHGRGMFQAGMINPAPTLPKGPGNLTATVQNGNQINLTWADSSSNENGFRIEQKNSAGGSFTEIATVGANVTNYADAGLLSNTQYVYRLRAYNTAGNSPYSNEATATTGIGSPQSPSGLIATPVSMSQINLVWNDGSTNEGGFRIERKTGLAGTYAEVATVGANVTSYSNTGLLPTTTYYYRVYAYNTGGNSGTSNEAYATTMVNPNLALNNPAAASSTSSPYFPTKAVDGNLTTYWRSGSIGKTRPVWWRVDLVTVTVVNRVVLRWQGNNYARIYQVQVSNDTVNYTTVFADSLGNGGNDDVIFTGTLARYIRVYMTKNNSGSERLTEVEVYAAPGAALSDVTPIDPTTTKVAPERITLERNYPDPFNPTTTIAFGLNEGTNVTLRIMNIAGQEVATLASGYHNPGVYHVTFDASNLSSGVYFSVLDAGVITRVRRMLLVK
jgi:photosystem II stability/assembly factor-like uncharacterized protein